MKLSELTRAVRIEQRQSHTTVPLVCFEKCNGLLQVRSLQTAVIIEYEKVLALSKEQSRIICP